VLLPLPEPSDVLLVSRDRDRTEELRAALLAQGHVVEVALGHRSALEAFFEAGGHDWVFLGADLPEEEARSLTDCLRAVEGRVRVL
jgi:PleD family two-component response regulator